MHSIEKEETLCDRSGRPDIDSQEGAWPQQFVIGKDEAELELFAEPRSFVKSGERSSAKKIFSNCRTWSKTFFVGKLPEQMSIYREHNRSHTRTYVRHVYKIGV